MIQHEKTIITAIGMIMLMEFVDISVLNTSLPQIAFSLQVNPIDLKIALTIYLLTLGAFIPAAGWFADRFGAKHVLLFAVSGFLLSSIACGLSVNVTMLAISRGAQGMFAAFISPVARIMSTNLFRERLAQISLKLATIYLMGLLFGPLIGGAITTWSSWRIIFFINVPVGLLALLIAYYYFPSIKASVKFKFDSKGFLLLAGALFTALFTIDTLTAPMISWIIKIMSIIISSFLFIAYYFHFRKTQTPIVNLNIFKNKIYRFFSLLLVTARLFAMNMGFIGPLYVQTQFQYSALQSGLLMSASILGVFLTRPVLKYFTNTFTQKQALVTIFLILITAQFIIAYSMLYFNLYIFMFALLLNGFGIGIFMPFTRQTMFKHLDKNLTNPGVIINSALLQISQGFAIALVALILIVASGKFTLDWHSVLPKSSYALVMCIDAVLLIVTMLFFKRLPKQTS